MSNPFLKDKKLTIAYVVIWGLFLSLHFCFLFLILKIPIYQSLIDSSFANISFALLALNLWYVVAFSNFDRATGLTLLINHSAAAIFTAGIWTTFNYFVFYTIYKNQVNIVEFYNQSLAWRVLTGLFYYFIFVLLYYLIIYYENFQEKKVNEANLKGLVKESELNYLKAQINPHFLFNSLNSISSLTISDPQKAQEMIIKLSTYLRYSLIQKEKFTLSEEIENGKLYLEIEKIRFGKRLEFEININNELLSYTVPSTILQPLYENAVKYGVQESTEPVIIQTNCSMESNLLKIMITNTLPERTSKRKGEGIGLKNISERLRLTYGRTDLLIVQQIEGKYEVCILIPV
jgi:hypothetical protein